MSQTTSILPTDPKVRKDHPIARGCLDYFPRAIAYIAHVSKVGNDQHNPGQEMHWAKEKSNDHADCIARHLIERGKVDTDGIRHSGKMAWRALALLELELEAAETPVYPHNGKQFKVGTCEYTIVNDQVMLNLDDGRKMQSGDFDTVEELLAHPDCESDD